MTPRKFRPSHPVTRGKLLAKVAIHAVAWGGIAFIYYMIFYFFFDTPVEVKLRSSTARLEQEYAVLQSRYDTLSRVLENIEQRDKNIYRTMFESEPYDIFSDEFYADSVTAEHFASFTTWHQMRSMRDAVSHLSDSISATDLRLRELIDTLSNASFHDRRVNYIPKIQPITTKSLSQLAGSFGLRVQPFYKTLGMHYGVDYATPIGTRVYATADGTVQGVNNREGASSGISVSITHGNSGYKTFYAHLSRAVVRNGQQVRQGDIIGLSGNSGLSFAPHLHYEISYKNLKIDPINYFFKELSPEDYIKLRNIAKSRMQSLD